MLIEYETLFGLLQLRVNIKKGCPEQTRDKEGWEAKNAYIFPEDINDADSEPEECKQNCQ